MMKIVNNIPHGFGRLIENKKCAFADSQFKDGMSHGYYREISKNGSLYLQEY